MDAQEKTCPHCGTVFGNRPQAQKVTFQPPEPAPEPAIKQHSPIAPETPRPVPAQKPPAPAESRQPAAAPVAEKVIRRDPGSRKNTLLFWVVPLIIIFAILVAAMIGVPYLAALLGSPGGGYSPPQELQETYSVYNNPSLGFTIQYPESWTFTAATEPGAPHITDITFTGSDKATGLLIQVADESGTASPASLDERAENAIAVLGRSRSDFTLVNNEKTTISGNVARRFEFTAVTGSGKKMRSVVYLTEKRSRVYNIAFVTADSMDAGTSEVQQKVLSSFVLTS